MKTDDSRRAIGTLVAVTADRFVIELHGGTDSFTVVGFDDMHYVARLGTFTLLPIPNGYIVAEVIGLRDQDSAAKSSLPAAEGRVLDKAASAKYLDTVPVGTITKHSDGSKFVFGVSVFPSLYAEALYAKDEELDCIFEVAVAEEPSNSNKHKTATRYKALTVGTSVVFKGYDVKVDIDAFFGGHSAILGNTGSGKSCTVATILQSLFSKEHEHPARGATFLILDVNGEYASAFAELPIGIRRTHLHVESPGEQRDKVSSSRPFRLPHWLMTVEEWELLLRASERTQQPVLRTALGLASMFASDKDSDDLEELKTHVLACCCRAILHDESSSTSKGDRLTALIAKYKTAELNLEVFDGRIDSDYGKLKANVSKLAELFDKCIIDDVDLPAYDNSEFSFEALGDALDLALFYEESQGNKQIRDYCSQMISRYEAIKRRDEFAFLRCDPNELKPYERDKKKFVDCLSGKRQFRANGKEQSQIVLLDLNDAEDEVVEVASAVVSRLIFERQRTLDPRNSCPIHLVLEEAHRYAAEKSTTSAIDASRVFERVAKEGRKYGLFLILASQRPSELSATVLSQCSNYVVHRIQNPDDLQHIRQMTPFISDNVLRRLPSLPKQHALIFGSAVNIPTTFRVRDVSPKPDSDDAKIRDLWFID